MGNELGDRGPPASLLDKLFLKFSVTLPRPSQHCRSQQTQSIEHQLNSQSSGGQGGDHEESATSPAPRVLDLPSLACLLCRPGEAGLTHNISSLCTLAARREKTGWTQGPVGMPSLAPPAAMEQEEAPLSARPICLCRRLWLYEPSVLVTVGPKCLQMVEPLEALVFSVEIIISLILINQL